MLDLTPTPEELAFEFSHMGDGDQAAFFNELARLTALWDHPLCFQLQYVTDSKILTAAGRGVMRMIGEYADENPPII
jgi:hypothetical protein